LPATVCKFHAEPILFECMLSPWCLSKWSYWACRRADFLKGLTAMKNFRTQGCGSKASIYCMCGSRPGHFGWSLWLVVSPQWNQLNPIFP
jgi:hypothetical protein